MTIYNPGLVTLQIPGYVIKDWLELREFGPNENQFQTEIGINGEAFLNYSANYSGSLSVSLPQGSVEAQGFNAILLLQRAGQMPLLPAVLKSPTKTSTFLAPVFRGDPNERHKLRNDPLIYTIDFAYKNTLPIVTQ